MTELHIKVDCRAILTGRCMTHLEQCYHHAMQCFACSDEATHTCRTDTHLSDGMHALRTNIHDSRNSMQHS